MLQVLGNGVRHIVEENSECECPGCDLACKYGSADALVYGARQEQVGHTLGWKKVIISWCACGRKYVGVHMVGNACMEQCGHAKMYTQFWKSGLWLSCVLGQDQGSLFAFFTVAPCWIE